MKISKKTLMEVVSTEYAAARQWCKGDGGHNGHYYKMMIDTSNGNIWIDEFLTVNDYKVYHSESIMQLSVESMEAAYGLSSNAKQEYLEDAIRKLKKAGWEIEE